MSANVVAQEVSGAPQMYTYSAPTTYGSPATVQYPYGATTYAAAPQVYMVAPQTTQHMPTAYAAWPLQYMQQPVSTVYGAPPVTNTSAPAAYQIAPYAEVHQREVTYMKAPSQSHVTYVQPQTYAAPAVYQAPSAAYATTASTTNLASVPSMVAVPQYQFYTDHTVADQVIANINQIGGYGPQGASEMPTAVGVPQLTPTPPPAEPAVAKKPSKSGKSGTGQKSIGSKKKRSGCC